MYRFFVSPQKAVSFSLLAILSALAGCTAAEPITEQDDNLELTENPANVLSCVVSWTTEQPATSRVEFGADGALAYAIEEEGLSSEHKVFVVGMREAMVYTLEAVSVAEDGTEYRSDPMTFQTGELPFPLPRIKREVFDKSKVQSGWTLTQFTYDGTGDTVTAVALDMDGMAVWYHDLGENHDLGGIEVSHTVRGNVLIGGALPEGVRPVEVTLAGEVMWEGLVQGPMGTSNYTHHTLQALPNGDYLSLDYGFDDGALYDVIHQRTPDGEVVWRWDSRAILDGEGSTGFWGNMVRMDLEDDSAYYNARPTNQLIKIDRPTGDILWRLGQDGDFLPMTDGGPIDPNEFWFHGAHAPEILPGNRILVYDNGGTQRDYSRVVEYELDEFDGTARISWTYPADPSHEAWYNYNWGDADRLLNGNTLVTGGGYMTDDTVPTIFEVTPAGEKVWQITVSPQVGQSPVGMYSAVRMPSPLEIL